MQEQLCAYLFGELEAKDKAHVEQRLAESEVWRSERDRLNGTIGLVQAAMKAEDSADSDSEQLSDEALQRLALAGTQAAAGYGNGTPAVAKQGSPMRIFVPVAATIAVALGGFLAFQKMQAMPEVNSEATAKADGTLSDIAISESEAVPEARFARSSATGSVKPDGDEKRPIFNVKNTGEIIVRKGPLYSPETHDGRRESMDDVKRKLAIIAKNMEQSGGLPDSHLMVRGDRSVPFEQVQQVMQETAQKGTQVWKVQLGASMPNPGAPGSVIPRGSGILEPFPLDMAPSKKGSATYTLRGTQVGRQGKNTNSEAPARSSERASGNPGTVWRTDAIDPARLTGMGQLPEKPLAGDWRGLQEKRAKVGAPAQSAGVATSGHDLFLLDKGEAVQPASGQAPPTSHGGSYRGPGDTKPPGGGQGLSGGTMPVPPSLNGPSTPGPSSAVAPGPSGSVVIGLELKEIAGDEAAQRAGLAGMGYAGPEQDGETQGEGASEELASELGRSADLGAFYDDAADGKFRERMEELYRQQGDAKDKASKPKPGQGLASDFTVDRFEGSEREYETPQEVESRLREEIAKRAAKRHERLIRSCIPRPTERPNAMYYRWWGDNPFEYVSSDAQATFAADVDTASYTLARRYLTGGNLPTREQVRTEEFVNYFAGDIPAPTEDVFAVQTEMSLSPFGSNKNRYMLRVGIRGKVIPKDERPPMALVFVVDTSGSMASGNRMELVKHSLRLLGTELDGRDQIGVVSFSSEASLILPMTSMDERGKLESAVQSLSTGGSTNVEDGIRLGYELLSRVPADGRLRRVVLISDGVANTGSTVADEILKSVKMHRENGIYLSTVGVGMGNHNDALLERLANRGDGICDYVDDADAARRAMVERFSGGFIPIARDLKIQLEFTGGHVLRYRQIGYENRAVADADFRNDAVDGGEVGSGHQVTALFELECVELPHAGVISELDFGKVRLRYKSIATGSDQQVFETEHVLRVNAGPFPFDKASAGFARSVIAAQFAEVLRKSTHADGDDYSALVAHATRIAALPAFAGDGETQELAGMIRRAGKLGAGAPVQRGELWTTVDSYRRHRYLCGTESELNQGKLTSERLAEIASINASLEERIRELSLQEALQGR